MARKFYDLDLYHLLQWPLNSSVFVLPSQPWVLHTLGTVDFSKGKSDPITLSLHATSPAKIL